MEKLDDIFFMRRCLSLAKLGRPSPNPFVGAVIVRNGRIIGSGWHHAAGKKHAEVEAILDVEKKFGKSKARSLLASSTLYVNLEPCNHFGRQPPCTKAILEHNIPRVVFAMLDPNPNVRGGGEKKLRVHGIRTSSGVLEDEARELNKAFAKQATTGLPYLTLKMARTADGRYITHAGEPRWISGPQARKMVHQMRDKAGALIVGIGTVLADDPQLTTRLAGKAIGHDPMRVIIDEELEIPLNAKALKDKNAMIVCGRSAADGAKKAKKRQIEKKKRIKVFTAPILRTAKKASTGHPLLDISHVLRHLSARGIDHVLCEGGPSLAASLIENKLVDELLLFTAPKRKKSAGGRAGGMKTFKPTESELRLNRAIIKHMKAALGKKVGADRLSIYHPSD